MDNYALYKQEAALKLFKGYIVKEKDLQKVTTDFDNGLIIEGEFNTNNNDNEKLIDIIHKLYSKDGIKLNQSFHKSFETVKMESMSHLIGEQLIHYFTTYGFDSLGIYDKDLVYVPKEELNVPGLTDDIKFIVIHNFSISEIRDKILSLLTGGIALSKDTIENLKILSDFIPRKIIHTIKNREFRLYLYDKYNMVPRDPEMFLKYILYKITDSTQTIFNEYKFNYNLDNPKGVRIRRPNPILSINNEVYKSRIQSYFEAYISNYGDTDSALKSLAPYYNRYKTFFMTLKENFKDPHTITKMRSWINRISKCAKRCEKVSTTKKIDSIFQEQFVDNDILNELDDISIFRELRLLNYIHKEIQKHKDSSLEKNLYRIRNGKIYVTPYDNERKSKISVDMKTDFYNLVYNHLIERLGKKLNGKSIFIPNNAKFAIPTSEKQFLGEIPNKSYISIPRGEDIVIGVHWYNLPNNRVDLDLHMVNKDKQFGWNSAFRNEGKDIVYSGDMTDAILPNGASEYFLIEAKTSLDSFLITLNNFNATYNKNGELDYELIIAKRKSNQEFHRDYCVDPNDIIVKINRKMYKIDGRQTCLGLLDVTKDEIRFYFSNFDMGFSRVTGRGQVTSDIYQALKEDLKYNLDLASLLKDSGMILLDTPYKEELREVKLELVPVLRQDERILYEKVQVKADYDLSLEKLTKDTLISMLSDIDVK